MPQMPRQQVWLGLGSNLADPVKQLALALTFFRQHSAIDLLAVSPVYQSPAMVLPEQNPAEVPDYLNLVVQIATDLAPDALLAALKSQERQQGRNLSAQRWSSRPIDLDILVYGSLVLSTAQLVLPHPGIASRDFVLLPWQDVAPNTVIPELGTVADCAAALPETSAKRVADSVTELAGTA